MKRNRRYPRYCGFCLTPCELRVSIGVYRARVRCLRVRVRCRKTRPSVYPWQTLLTLAHGEPAINFPRESPDCDHEYEPIVNPQLSKLSRHRSPPSSFISHATSLLFPLALELAFLPHSPRIGHCPRGLYR